MANQRPKNKRRTVKTNNVCVVCGVSIAHKYANARYCSERCYYQSPAYKRAQANYARSPKGKAVMKKYQNSPKGIAAQRRANERFNQRAKNQDAASDQAISIERDLASES